MLPSYKWFPTNLQERAAWFKNFSDRIQIIGASLGLTPAELESIARDNDNIQFVAAVRVQAEAYLDGVRQYRKIFTEGDIGDPTPQFPADPAFILPHPSQPTGAFERLDDIVTRIRAAAAYTEETGATLGTIPRSRQRAAPEDSAPEITAAVTPGSSIEVRFIRGRSHGISLQTNPDNGGWTNEGRFYMSPAVFKVIPSETGSPRSVQLRARFLDGNDPVGDWSAIVTVQTIP